MSVLSFLRDTKSIGELSEIIVRGALAGAGYRVAVPLGENHRYDLIVDKGGTLARVQVKTGRVRKRAVHFQLLQLACTSPRPYLENVHR
ncbi:MAG: group I intron-associated PD-(D/E)XK endonuclease [Candidatus Cybelea sp.]